MNLHDHTPLPCAAAADGLQTTQTECTAAQAECLGKRGMSRHNNSNAKLYETHTGQADWTPWEKVLDTKVHL